RGHQARGRAFGEHALLQRDGVQQATTGATDGLGEGDPEQSGGRGLDVELARDGPGVLPLLDVGGDLPAGELRGCSLQRSAVLRRGEFFGNCRHSRPPSTMTQRERTHSPRALAWGSTRVDAATPAPSRRWMTTLTAPSWGRA